MTATNHMLTGAIIGVLMPAPVAIPLAFASHFVLDSLPHYGDKNHVHWPFFLVLFGDAILGTVLILALVMQQPVDWQWAVAGAVAAASPDFMWLPHWLRELSRKPKRPYNMVERFHKNIQWGERWYFGPVELVWGVLAVSLLVNLFNN